MDINDLSYEQVIDKAQKDATNLLYGLGESQEHAAPIHIANKMGYKVANRKSDGTRSRYVENIKNDNGDIVDKVIVLTSTPMNSVVDENNHLPFTRKVELLYTIAMMELKRQQGCGIDYEYSETEEKRNAYLVPTTNEEIYAREVAESILMQKYYLAGWLKELRYKYGKSYPGMSLAYIAQTYDTSSSFVEHRMKQYGIKY